MAKLTKAETKAHNQACELLKKDVLTHDEKWFVLDNWHEGAEHNNGSTGAFFTPSGMALDFAIDVGGKRVLDLCAGIGALSFAAWVRNEQNRYEGMVEAEYVCIEINPAYIEIGKKIMPQATWVQGDASDLEFIKSLGRFDCVISNPPFGKRAGGNGNAPRYTGADFEYKIMDIASEVADYGVFIIPQQSSSFFYSGRVAHRDNDSAKLKKFRQQTGITMDCGVGVDTAYYKDDWKGVAPICEIVTCNFEELQQQRKPTAVVIDFPVNQFQDPVEQLSLFA
ncbi:methyltransferase [Aestuariispira insulae]|uniref:Methyltransferase family protein n=1 Tax=Aestuariispira insulae TaxID=1461337 RepID=A0A3D9H3P3_9PROT|nr:methyltransferase [Aestuariispira insulae]RED44133.1 methyltransferase family protein [Aestuariispira insulae]